MNVSLTPQLEALVNAKVKNGMYQTASEVIREGLRLLKERDDKQQRRLREDVLAGLAQVKRGQYTEYDADNIGQLADDIKARGRRRLAREAKKLTR
jgi:antitoxin ParD1/3/4